MALRHHRVQRLRRLLARRSARQSERAFVLEGRKLVEEALAAGVVLEGVYAQAGWDDPLLARAHDAGLRVWTLAPGVIERVADATTPQPVLAVAPMLDVPLAHLAAASLVVVCVDVRDPGNAGTVIRSAEAAGAGGVVCCEGSVDVYNPKTVRASAGTLFHVPLVVGGDPQGVLTEIGRWGMSRLATVARDGRVYTDVDLRRPVAFVMGNEAHGLPAGLGDVVDDRIAIPMSGRAESLNVGMAAAVLCFEAARQRRAAAGGGP